MTLENSCVLFISYNGMLEPLGQSQVLPYLRDLASRGVRFSLISFERPKAYTPDGLSKCEELEESLRAEGIDWNRLRYHKWPSLAATMFDVVQGIRLAKRLMGERKIELIHARSHIPATIAMVLKKRFDSKMIFDVRGLMAEEYVDADHWTKSGIPYRLTKRIERRVLAATDGVVTLTQRIWPIIKTWPGLRARDVVHEVVPCCVDLGTFRFNAEAREQRRQELGLSSRRVIVYSGSIGGWYATEQMIDLFVQFQARNEDWHFLWLTRGLPEFIHTLMAQRGVAKDHYTIKAIEPGRVASYLAAADLGVAFYKPGLSRLATSPVKMTEYLACGLPVVINAGVGDADALVAREGVGAVVREFSDIEYSAAASAVEPLLNEVERTRLRTRALAERSFDVHTVGAETYARLYRNLLT